MDSGNILVRILATGAGPRSISPSPETRPSLGGRGFWALSLHCIPGFSGLVGLAISIGTIFIKEDGLKLYPYGDAYDDQRVLITLM
ncbi:hypothetical protein HYQ46_002552 [Verticillium longisporum]|nr:hypothetical protein HYQ46_002552 [Verticillium longisporum]